MSRLRPMNCARCGKEVWPQDVKEYGDKSKGATPTWTPPGQVRPTKFLCQVCTFDVRFDPETGEVKFRLY